jgi:hypothetical protein
MEQQSSRRAIILGVAGVIPVAGCLDTPSSEPAGAHLSVSNYTETERTIRVEVTADGERLFYKMPILPPAESKLYENVFEKTRDTTVTVTVDGIGERSTTWETNPGAMLEAVVESNQIKFEVSTS